MNTTELAKQQAELTGKIVVVDSCGKRRNLKLYQNGSSVYVRTSKRGQIRQELTGHRICCKDPLIVEFKID